MTQPLALVFYERLLPGTQLVNRLQDIGYRVKTVHAAETLVATAEAEGPLVVFADLEATKSKVADGITQLKEHAATSHLPVIAFAPENKLAAHSPTAGTMVVSDAALLGHLSQLLDQALQLE